MKTLTLKAFGRDVEVFFTLNHYSMNNNLCINMVAVNEGPWSTLTTNFDVNLEPDEAFIDTNNNWRIDTETVTSSFIGYAPYDNPKMSIIVTSPDSSRPNSSSNYASQVTYRITKEITTKYTEMYGID